MDNLGNYEGSIDMEGYTVRVLRRLRWTKVQAVRESLFRLSGVKASWRRVVACDVASRGVAWCRVVSSRRGVASWLPDGACACDQCAPGNAVKEGGAGEG